jgi:hypothetical protein
VNNASCITSGPRISINFSDVQKFPILMTIARNFFSQ